MKSSLNRREMLAGTAAMSVALGAGFAIAPSVAKAAIPRTFVPSVAEGSCAGKHAHLAQRLTDLASDPALSRQALNHAIKTWHCPDCNTRISSELAKRIAAARSAATASG